MSTPYTNQAVANLNNRVTSGHLCWIEVDLDAIAENVRSIRSFLPAKVELLTVVKANAYGHGAVPVSQVALAAGASRLGIGSIDEAAELRAAGINATILLLGYTPASDAHRVVDLNLIPTVNTIELAHELGRIAQQRRVDLPIHIKVDTGMGRFGLLPDEVEPFLREVSHIAGLHVEGIFTHFACADEPDKSCALGQLERFEQLLDSLSRSGYHFDCVHAANSAAMLDLPGSLFNMVRCGLAVYGYHPSGNQHHQVRLRPALSLKSRVSRIRTLPGGSGVGYGHIFTTDRPTEIALASIGYSDGVRRSFSGRGNVLIRGQRVPIVGRVSMGYITAVVDGLGVEQDEEVVLIGRQGNDYISAEEVAKWSDTIVYEVFTGLADRLPRIYLRNGQPFTSENTTDQAGLTQCWQ